MSGTISHEGIAEDVREGFVRVRIRQSSSCAASCAACEAKEMCVSADNREKVVDAVCSAPGIKAGDRVTVHVRERLAWRAVLLAYILPFVVLAGVLAGLQLSGRGEAASGVAALCAVGVYYIVLSLFKGRLKKSFSFTAEKTEKDNN